MSTILKALEKARRERAQARSDQGDSAELLTAAPPPPTPVIIRRKPRWGLVLASILASTVLTLVALAVVLMFLQSRMTQWAQNLPAAMWVAPAVVAPAQGLSPSNVVQPAQPSPVAGIVPSPQAAPVVSRTAPAQTPAPLPAVDLPTPVPMSELLDAGPPAGTVVPPAKFSSSVWRESPSPAVGAASAPARADENAGFVLGPILYDPRSPMAIVNGQSVREGGVYENFRVLKITPDSVTVQRAGETPVVLRKRR